MLALDGQDRWTPCRRLRVRTQEHEFNYFTAFQMVWSAGPLKPNSAFLSEK